MRINSHNKSMDIEERDINFIMDSYALNYMFHSRNIKPEVIVIPMFAVAKTRYGNIPIQFVPDMSEAAVDVAEDGKNITEATPEQVDEIAIQDTKMQQIKQEVKVATKPKAAQPGYISGIATVVDKEISIQADRAPKQPAGPIIPPGTGGLSLPPRDPSDLRHTAMDLAPERDIDESKQQDIIVIKDSSGNKRLS